MRRVRPQHRKRRTMSTNPRSVHTAGNVPVYAIAAAVGMLALLIIGLIFIETDENSTPALMAVVGIGSASIPALIAAAFSERASRDIRNGYLQEKVKHGAEEALEETGVTEVVETVRHEPKKIAAAAVEEMLRRRLEQEK